MEKLAVYIHWPYCARICPYCDFNVYKGGQNDALVKAIIADLSHWRNMFGPREISSIHFGGGTPSLMKADDVRSIIECVDVLWKLPRGAEIGLEANPQDQNEEQWQSLAQAGINRLSLGAQSFHDPALAFLGRDHNAKAATTALELAMDIFPNVSLDLIFGWFGQTLALLKANIDIALKLNPQHISAYQLTIEQGTAFERAQRRGKIMAVDDDLSAEFYDLIETRLSAAGYDHYEVSNYARDGRSSKHNLAYWQGLDYVGVGPGAHGRITKDGVRKATIAHNHPTAYIKAVNDKRTGISETEILTRQDWASEYLLMGLRITDGISLTRYEQILGECLDRDSVHNLEMDGYVLTQGDRISVTPKGRAVLNKITEMLLV